MIPRIDTTMGKISSRPLCSILEFQYNRMDQIKHFARKVNQFNRSKLVSELIYNIQAKQIPHIGLPKRKRSAAISHHRRQKCQIQDQRNHENHIRMTRSLTCRRRMRGVRVWIDRRPPRSLNERGFDETEALRPVRRRCGEIEGVSMNLPSSHGWVRVEGLGLARCLRAFCWAGRSLVISKWAKSPRVCFWSERNPKRH